MSQVTIQLPPGTEERLREKASVQRKTLESYLEELAQKDAFGANDGESASEPEGLSLDEFDRLLDELSVGLPALPSLPADFSRADIYADHD